MRLLNDLKIVAKVALIVAVPGCALLGIASFSAFNLSRAMDDYLTLSEQQSAAWTWRMRSGEPRPITARFMQAWWPVDETKA